MIPHPFRLVLLVLACALAPAFQCPVLAHRLGSSTLRLERRGNDGWSGRLTVPLRDLASLVSLDADGDEAITWGELQRADAALQDQIRHQVLPESGSTPAALRLQPVAVDSLAGEPCASWELAWDSPVDGPRAGITYGLLFDLDPEHRCLVSLEDPTSPATAGTFVLSPERKSLELPGPSHVSKPTSWTGFVAEGVHHIAIGFDHILFLVALLLPSVVRSRGATESGPARFRAVAAEVTRIVTAFTVAHSITLALAASDAVRLPSRAVETVIAASVAVAALDNLVPFLRDRGWQIAFGFGLVHGFGFAGVLSELALPRADFAKGVVAFNVGVELGQLILVASFLPIAFALRGSWVYRRIALQGGSVAIAGLALVWTAERAFGG